MFEGVEAITDLQRMGFALAKPLLGGNAPVGGAGGGLFDIGARNQAELVELLSRPEQAVPTAERCPATCNHSPIGRNSAANRQRCGTEPRRRRASGRAGPGWWDKTGSTRVTHQRPAGGCRRTST